MKKILLSIIAIAACGFILSAPTIISAPAFATGAECDCKDRDGNITGHGYLPEASILKDDTFCECGNGESVKATLRILVDIMTIGIAVLAAAGIAITGTQYLTAGGNEEKTKKAKRRLLEIVIGLFAYVVLYAVLRFLIPGFNGF